MRGNRLHLEQISRYARGTLAAGEVRDLEIALRQNVTLRRYFLEYVNVDAALAEYAALPDGEVAESGGVQRVGTWFRAFLPWATVAAAFLLITAVAVRVKHTARIGAYPENAVAVEVLSARRARLEGRTTTIHDGEYLRLSALRLQQGSLRLRLASGVVLDLLGPLEGGFEGPARLRLVHGGLNVDVGMRGKGFTVVTEAGDLIDLGTRFAVNVRQEGQADIAVFSGQVRVRENGTGPGGAVVTVSEGEALRLRAGRQADRLLTVPLKPEGMAMDLAGAAPVVISVADSIDDSEFRRFYGVAARGMRAGTLVYTDKPQVVWQAAVGEAFPVELLGADVVRTFHSDRHALDLKIILQLACPATVYVLHDARAPPLDWLVEGFENTGLRMRSGPWQLAPAVWDLPDNTRGEVYVEYTVWRARAPAGGRIKLGPPHVRGEGGAKVMFGIAVKSWEPNQFKQEQTGG